MLASLAQSRKADACSIAIVGGGASGALMTAHLLRFAGDAVRLTLVEPRAKIGRGLAYATENESHRLNVRASNMSVFPDDPDHFWRWLRAARCARSGSARPLRASASATAPSPLAFPGVKPLFSIWRFCAADTKPL